MKYIIACCATAQTPDDIKMTSLDAIHWTDRCLIATLFQNIVTIRSTFNAAGFKNKMHEYIPTAALNSLSATSMETTTTAIINETDDQLKGLDDYLKNITIGRSNNECS